MPRTPAPSRTGPVLAVPVLPGSAGPAAQPVAVGAVITAFPVDSGVQTRALPWTTGSSLATRWGSAAPVANPDQYTRRQGFALAGDSVALAMAIRVSGTRAGLAQVGIHLASLEATNADGAGLVLTREMVEDTLRNEGLTLQPVQRRRKKEGASCGNLVDLAKAWGKGASGLWWRWDSPMQQPNLSLTILCRRAEMAQVECQEG